MLPATRERFHDLVRLSMVVLGSVLAMLLPFMVVRGAVFDWFPAWSVLGDWYFLLPVGVGVLALSTILTQWLFREKAFAPATTIGGGTNVALRLFNIGYGALSHGALHGLITGELVVRGLSMAAYWRALRDRGWGILFSGYRWERLRSVAREYRTYPLFIFPERWVSLAGMQAPIFLLAADPQAVGHYALAMGLMLLPLRQLGYSLGTVFQQKAAETQRDRPEDLPRITHGLYRRLLIIGVPLFAVITFFSDAVFALVLGEPWRVAGAFASALGPFFLLRLLTEPIASLAYVKRAEQLLLWFQVALLIPRVAAIMLMRDQGAGAAIGAFSLVSAAGYVVLAALLLRQAGIGPLRTLGRSLLFMGGCGSAMALLRYLLLGTWFPTL